MLKNFLTFLDGHFDLSLRSQEALSSLSPANSLGTLMIQK